MTEIDKAFEDHPKVKMQAFSIKNTDSKGRQTEYMPTSASTHPRGKSLILRRPKYQVVAQPDQSLQKTPGHKSIGQLTPNRRLRHEDAVTFANAYKNKSKKVTTSTGYKFKHEVGKSEKSLRRQKKVSAATSIVGGTLGLGGLTALALKKPDLASRLSIGAGGFGGVGAYNYASIQNQEAKKKTPRQSVYVVRNKKQIKNIKSGLEPVTKGASTMDFGLGGVYQGEHAEVISKKQQKSPGQQTAGEVGMVATPAAGFLGARAAKGAQAGFGIARGTGASKLGAAKAGASMIKPAVAGAAKGGTLLGAAMRSPIKTAALATAGAFGGEKAYGMMKPIQPGKPKKPTATIGKSAVFKAYNPEQKRQRRLDNASTALGVASGGTLVGAAHQAKQAYGKAPYSYTVPKRGAIKEHTNRNHGSGLRSDDLGKFGGRKMGTASGFKGGVRSAGAAGALGLTAVGLAVGSDRVRAYRRGNGGSYRQLHRSS